MINGLGDLNLPAPDLSIPPGMANPGGNTMGPVTGPKLASDQFMAGISNLLTGVSGLTSDIIQGESTAIGPRFQAAEAGFNAQEEGLNVKELWNQEMFQEQRKEEEGGQLAGSERAAQAGQGVNVRSAASTAVTQETAKITGQDVFTLRSNAFQKAFGFKVKGMEDTAEAALQTLTANNAENAGLWGALTSFAGSGLKAMPELGIE